MKAFDEVFEDKTKYGTKIKTSEYRNSGLHVIIDQGQKLVAGYTNLKEGLFEDVPVIIFGDHTRVVKYVDKPFFLGADGVKILKSKIENANHKYLYYALVNAKIPDTGYNRHFKWLKEVRINYPDLAEQQKIVDILDKVERIISAERQQLEELDMLTKSRFVEMFGDPVLNDKGFKTIVGKDFFKLSNGKAVPETKRTLKGIPAWGGNGISWYTDQMLFEEDTLVVGRVGFQSGNVHLAKGPLWITDNAMYISDFYVKDYNLIFLCELMEYIDFTRYQDAGDLKKITQKPFMEMRFIFPPVELQNQFATFVRQIDKLKVVEQRRLEKLQLLFDSLMQKYFG